LTVGASLPIKAAPNPAGKSKPGQANPNKTARICLVLFVRTGLIKELRRNPNNNSFPFARSPLSDRPSRRRQGAPPFWRLERRRADSDFCKMGGAKLWLSYSGMVFGFATQPARARQTRLPYANPWLERQLAENAVT
jgi:hypothetical protein